MLKSSISILCFILVFPQLIAQQDSSRKKAPADLRNSILLGFSYTRQAPVGELSKRFAANNAVGFTLAKKFGRNFQVQACINTMFSGKVKENGLFDSMAGSAGFLIDVNGSYTEIRMYERGYNWHVDFGKIIPLNKFERNSGLLVTAGLGFLQHKIKFEYARSLVPQLDNGYYKGYDRLTNGLLLRGFIGYQRIDPNGMLNFFAGLEVMNGLTMNRREFNYDTRVKDDHLRNDLLIGFKLGIMITLAGRKAGLARGDEERYFE